MDEWQTVDNKCTLSIVCDLDQVAEMREVIREYDPDSTMETSTNKLTFHLSKKKKQKISPLYSLFIISFLLLGWCCIFYIFNFN